MVNNITSIPNIDLYNTRTAIDPLPDWLNKNFFNRISPESKQRIAEMTSGIHVTSEQISSLKERRLDTNPFFKTNDWIYVALKAFAKGHIDDFEISDLVLYDSCRRDPSFQCYTATTPTKWVEIIRRGFDESEEKAFNCYRIDWGKAIEQLAADLPEKDAHIYSYRHAFKNYLTDKTESGVYGDVLLSFMPIIPIESDNEWLSAQEVEVLILPPTLLKQLLINQFGKPQASCPAPCLGYLESDDLTDDKTRVMSIQHPDFAVIADPIHGYSHFKPWLQAVYFHDTYHLILDSSIPCRDVCIDLGCNFTSSLLENPNLPSYLPIILKKLRALFLDRNIHLYMNPKNTDKFEPIYSYAKNELSLELRVRNCPEEISKEIIVTILSEMKKYIELRYPAS